MAVTRRFGDYGLYYGNDYRSSNSLTIDQMKLNATYIKAYLSAKGWSLNAIAGILGNMQHESAINPGRWQSDNVGNMSGGYGLVQWTPASKYINWLPALEDASTMDNNLSRIIYEIENNIQWIATSDYNYSFRNFTTSEDTPYTLACAFAWNYERSYVVLYGTEEQKEALRQRRGGSANFWYEYLGGQPTPTGRKKDNFKWVLYAKKLRTRRL